MAGDDQRRLPSRSNSMKFTDKLNSDENIVETIYYRNNSSGAQESVSDDQETPGSNNEIITVPPVSSMATYIQQPQNPGELAQQELRDNRLVNRLYNSRNDLMKFVESQTLENALNQLRNNMFFRNIQPIVEGLSVTDPFPLKNFPVWAISLVSEIADSLQVPIEAVAPALLGAMFIAARGNYEIKVKSGYHEILTGYILVVMPSGGRKSAIVYFFRRPINAIEANRQMDFDANATSRKSDREALVYIKRL